MSLLLEQALLWPVLLPLVAAMLTVAMWGRRRAQQLTALVTLVLLLGSALLLLGQVVTGGIQVLQFGGWEAPFGIGFTADRLGSVMVLVNSVLAFTVAVFGLAGVTRSQAHAGFQPLFLAMVGAINGAFLTGDLFNLYVWFEIMLITSVGLLLLDRSRAQLDGAMRYLLLNLFGTVLFLIAVAMLYGMTGTLNMADLAVKMAAAEPGPGPVIAALLFLLSFGIKGAYVPLFFWLPASYHTASITVSALFAGLLTKVGVYATYRVFSLILPAEMPGIRELMAVVAALTMVIGVLGAAIQWDVRRILSFHIISQIGYMLFGLAVGGQAALAGSVFYLVHHMIVKTNLFLVAGAMRASLGTFDLRLSGGLLRSRPLLVALFLVPALSLAGIPPLSGFWSKYLVIDASFRGGEAWLGAVGLFVGIMTLFSMSKIWIEAYLKPAPEGRKAPGRVPAAMIAASTILALLTVWIGLQPETLVSFARATAAELADPAALIGTVLPGVELP